MDSRGPSVGLGLGLREAEQSYPPENIRIMRYQRLKNLVLLMTAAAYFAAVFLGQKLKRKILCEKLLFISQRFFGIPPFRFYALADGICNVLSCSSPALCCGPTPEHATRTPIRLGNLKK